MNLIRWHKPKWLPRLLSMPVPEPSQQASQILAIQRNIVLPIKGLISIIVFYYLFYLHLVEEASPQHVALDFLKSFFIFYICFNAVAAALLVLRRFPHKLVPWVVFTVGLVDGLLLAGMTVETGGFGSALFWVFPGLIVLNALSIPLAAPQIVLNLSLCSFYLGAGLVNLSLGDLSLPANPQRVGSLWKLTAGDITNLDTFATKLKRPAGPDSLAQFLREQFSPVTLNLLSNYQSGTNVMLQRDIAEDLNRVIQGESIYEPRRFVGVVLSTNTSNLLAHEDYGTNFIKLNRALLLDAFPHELLPRHPKAAHETGFLQGVSSTVDEPAAAAVGTEFFILRLIILLLMTASCYGVQILSFRQRLSDEEARKSAARNDELRAAGRLAAEIAHQLKNPLGIINNAAFSLTRGLKEGRSDYNQQLEIIREEIERSDRIITQLMGYAQLSEGRVEKLDLPEELDRAISEVFPPGATYEIEIHRRYGAGLPALLMQRNHFSVVLVNVLQNAREALEGRGNISVHARSPDESVVEIVVADDGPGIAPEKLDKVFEAYFTSKEKGTGLGLAIVKHNVELYGGSVWAESELGKGARFHISFPAKTLIKTA